MQTLQRGELYTDKGTYAVMTRTAIVSNHAQLRSIADQLRSNAEELAFSTNPPTPENCRIAGAMVGWAFSLAPLCIDSRFDF
jgi:hypothetical protein